MFIHNEKDKASVYDQRAYAVEVAKSIEIAMSYAISSAGIMRHGSTCGHQYQSAFQSNDALKEAMGYILGWICVQS